MLFATPLFSSYNSHPPNLLDYGYFLSLLLLLPTKKKEATTVCHIVTNVWDGNV